jgi:hypothetical protein
LSIGGPSFEHTAVLALSRLLYFRLRLAPLLLLLLLYMLLLLFLLLLTLQLSLYLLIHLWIWRIQFGVTWLVNSWHTLTLWIWNKLLLSIPLLLLLVLLLSILCVLCLEASIVECAHSCVGSTVHFSGCCSYTFGFGLHHGLGIVGYVVKSWLIDKIGLNISGYLLLTEDLLVIETLAWINMLIRVLGYSLGCLDCITYLGRISNLCGGTHTIVGYACIGLHWVHLRAFNSAGVYSLAPLLEYLVWSGLDFFMLQACLDLRVAQSWLALLNNLIVMIWFFGLLLRWTLLLLWLIYWINEALSFLLNSLSILVVHYLSCNLLRVNFSYDLVMHCRVCRVEGSHVAHRMTHLLLGS